MLIMTISNYLHLKIESYWSILNVHEAYTLFCWSKCLCSKKHKINECILVTIEKLLQVYILHSSKNLKHFSRN